MTPDYAASVQRRADQAGVSLAQRLVDETSNIPLGRRQAGEVAVVVEQLLGALSDHMTGTNLLHDGGFTRAYEPLNSPSPPVRDGWEPISSAAVDRCPG